MRDLLKEAVLAALHRARESTLRWIGRQLTPYIPPRHSITISHSSMFGDPEQSAPFVQINEPKRGNMGNGAALEINDAR